MKVGVAELYFNTDQAFDPDPAANVRVRSSPEPLVMYKIEVWYSPESGWPVGVSVELAAMANELTGKLTSMLKVAAGVITFTVPVLQRFPRVIDFKLSESLASATRTKSALAAEVMVVAPLTMLLEPVANLACVIVASDGVITPAVVMEALLDGDTAANCLLLPESCAVVEPTSICPSVTAASF